MPLVPENAKAPNVGPGFWHGKAATIALKAYNDGLLDAHNAAEELSVKVSTFKWYAKHHAKKTGPYASTHLASDIAPYHVKKAMVTASGVQLEVDIITPTAFPNAAFAKSKASKKSKVEIALFQGKQIDWVDYFGIEKRERFDLRVVCAMFYASEKIANWKGNLPPHERAKFYELKTKALSYVITWAERFGKYALAACLGEFRHRRAEGTMKLVPATRAISRAAAQSAAHAIWGDKNKVVEAAAYMAEKFRDPAFFTGVGFGGRPWANIAATFLKWYKSEIPDIVWGDFVWDLSHNGGRFFDKCPLFANEPHCKALLDAKKQSKTGDVREWGGALLHKEWKAGLDLIEIAEMGAPEEN